MTDSPTTTDHADEQLHDIPLIIEDLQAEIGRLRAAAADPAEITELLDLIDRLRRQ